MVVSITILMVLFIAAVGETSEGNWKDYKAGMIVGWITLGIVVPFLVLILILLGFHIFIMIKGKTTYDFLMERRQKKIDE